MARSFWFVCVFLTAFPVRAAAAPPNTLTPKEVADGWVLLFDGETTFGWQIDGEAKVASGTLILGGDRATRAQTTTAFDWGNTPYALEVELRWEGERSPKYWLLDAMVGLPESARQKFIPQKIAVQSSQRFPAPPLRPYSFEVPAGSRLFVRNLKYRPGGFKALLNGKDLTGWKVHPGRKSKFAVTPEGWLNVTDGPGDLQTEGQWADFVLQLECKSNGKHLNSGIFFRALPGQYQQGYEAQIRNQFTAESTQEYAVEEFDPKTHRPTGKKQVKSTAVDYGTGAIYRRVPARRQAAKDGEWFTLTIAAHGRHLATWVNGIQQADWTDNRPPAENARNGCRVEKGALSIQGHDPTTDLSFRNIRLAELPAAPTGK